MRFLGLGIFVTDMPVMVRFYRDVLGFDITDDENAQNIMLTRNGVLFMLYRRKDFENMTARSFNYAPKINGHYEIAFEVENFAEVDRMFEEVLSKGAEPVMNPTTEPWGQRTFYISDPEGNLVEIGSFTE